MGVGFRFEDEGKSIFGHIYRPVAKVSLESPVASVSVIVWMVVDTGADYTILPRHFAEKLRISLEKDCIKDATFGVGGKQAIYFCQSRIKAAIGQIERNIPLAFLDSNEIPALMGRLGFLETIDTEFLKTHTVVFKD